MLYDANSTGVVEEEGNNSPLSPNVSPSKNVPPVQKFSSTSTKSGLEISRFVGI